MSPFEIIQGNPFPDEGRYYDVPEFVTAIEPQFAWMRKFLKLSFLKGVVPYHRKHKHPAVVKNQSN